MSKQAFTITLYSENHIGLIGRVATIFSRRKINIEKFIAAPSEEAGIHCFTIVINETAEVVRKLKLQLEKQIDIINAF